MKLLESMELVLYLMSLMESGNRVQVPKENLKELLSSLAQLVKLLGEDISPNLQVAIEDLFSAASAAEDFNMSVLTDSMKITIENGLLKIKSEIAEQAFKYFSYTDFEPTKEIVPLMREVVAMHYGGVDLD